jgi:hypothetical protein
MTSPLDYSRTVNNQREGGKSPQAGHPFMKNAKSKLTNEAASQRGWKLVERDMMPEQVATDLLCTLERLTNQQRKIYQDARVRVFQAVETRKPVEVKLASRMTTAKLSQLGKWISRTAKRRRGLQRKYEVAIKLPEETTKQQLLKQRLVAGLDVMAARMDLVVDAIQNELDGRDLSMSRTGDFSIQ